MTAGAATAGHSIGIMVVEDERDVLDAMTQLLALDGHRVYAGQTAAEVQEIYSSHLREGELAGKPSVDLIITDYRLGSGVTGLEAIRCLCAHIGRAVPAIVVTGDTSPSRLKEVTASGVLILHKPITGDEIRDAILNARAIDEASFDNRLSAVD